MQKTIAPDSTMRGDTHGEWLPLESIAHVRLTSEDPAHPIENALASPSRGGCWLANTPGKQTIEFNFAAPQDIRLVYVRFLANESRTQEYHLSWSADNKKTVHSLVRQQFNFSPGGARVEEETHHVQLRGATDLILNIIPDISGGEARAHLSEIKIA